MANNPSARFVDSLTSPGKFDLYIIINLLAIGCYHWVTFCVSTALQTAYRASIILDYCTNTWCAYVRLGFGSSTRFTIDLHPALWTRYYQLTGSTTGSQGTHSHTDNSTPFVLNTRTQGPTYRHYTVLHTHTHKRTLYDSNTQHARTIMMHTQMCMQSFRQHTCATSWNTNEGRKEGEREREKERERERVTMVPRAKAQKREGERKRERGSPRRQLLCSLDTIYHITLVIKH